MEDHAYANNRALLTGKVELQVVRDYDGKETYWKVNCRQDGLLNSLMVRNGSLNLRYNWIGGRGGLLMLIICLYSLLGPTHNLLNFRLQTRSMSMLTNLT